MVIVIATAVVAASVIAAAPIIAVVAGIIVIAGAGIDRDKTPVSATDEKKRARQHQSKRQPVR